MRAEFHANFPDQRTRILFINSTLLAGANTSIHFLLLRNLSQGQSKLRAAGQIAIVGEPHGTQLRGGRLQVIDRAECICSSQCGRPSRWAPARVSLGVSHDAPLIVDVRVASVEGDTSNWRAQSRR
jgi:hypothetical protein